MKRRVEETLADIASKRKEKGKASETSEAPTASAPATQADIAEVYEMVT